MSDKKHIDHAALASEYIDLQARAEQIKDRLDEIKALFATTLETATHDLGGTTVTVSPNRRLDTKKAEENYPVSEFPHVWKASIDTKKLRDEIGQNAYDGLTVEGVPRVTVKAAR